ncbi:transketolase C-terminal domain-containing protein [candidate division KSB1 bacterium]
MFPIDLSTYRPLSIGFDQQELTQDQIVQLLINISLARDSIVFFTGLANARGLGGHTGGAYDMVPEVQIIDGFMRGSDNLHPVLFDEAGHRVALQYFMAAVDERVSGMSPNDLLHYREHGSGLPGHPERDNSRGIYFSSGRLGHLFSYVNGVAELHPEKQIVLFGSDGSQQEGSDAEAARYAVAHNLNVVVIIDDNNITIEAHTADYLPGFSLEDTLKGHGCAVYSGDGEDYDALFSRISAALHSTGPGVVINRRVMAPGIAGIEDSTKGHDAVSPDLAIKYLEKRDHAEAAEMIRSAKKPGSERVYIGSSLEFGKNRSVFGTVLCDILDGMPPGERSNVLVVSADLGGSTGVDKVGQKHTEIYRLGGVMERNGVSIAAGFGSESGKQGVFATFSAFSEMVISEITMARLNNANVLFHFSHAGVDDMADNTCHYGVNNFFVDNGLQEGDTTKLYFPADPHQMRAVVEMIFPEPGLRFVFSTRSAVPYILDEHNDHFFHPDNGYTFRPGKDDFIRKGSAGYVISYGEMLYRALDAVERIRNDGVDIGLINKPCLNSVDEETMELIGKEPFILVVESQNVKTGLGSRFGTWLIERDYGPLYACMGSIRPGDGGVSEQVAYQGLDPSDIIKKIRSMV